jgi:hypothetical protein
LSLMHFRPEHRCTPRASEPIRNCSGRSEFNAHTAQTGIGVPDPGYRVLPRRCGDDPSAHLIRFWRAPVTKFKSYIPIHLLSSPKLWLGSLFRVRNGLGDLIELPCRPDVGFAHVERIALVSNALT